MNAQEQAFAREVTQTLRTLVDITGQVIRFVEGTREGIHEQGVEWGDLRRHLQAVRESLAGSPQASLARSGEGRLQLLQKALEDVYSECREANWDGYGARPVIEAVYREARRFCALLPTALRVPEISADPDGEICLEWHDGPGRAVSVSVGCDGQLTYAGLFGRNQVHGVEHLGAEFPEAILHEIQRLSSGRDERCA